MGYHFLLQQRWPFPVAAGTPLAGRSTKWALRGVKMMVSQLRATAKHAALWLSGNHLVWALCGEERWCWAAEECGNRKHQWSKLLKAVQMIYLWCSTIFLTLLEKLKLGVQEKAFKVCFREFSALYKGMQSKSYLFRLSAKYPDWTSQSKGFLCNNSSQCVCRIAVLWEASSLLN